MYSANVFDPVGLIDKDLLSDYDKASVIWGIDGDWMVNVIEKGTAFYPTDHCGVLRCDTNIIHPRYLAHLIEQAGVQKRFSRSYRASLDRLREITIEAPAIKVQNRVMLKVEKLQAKIDQLEEQIPNITDEVASILNRYLN